LRQKALPTSPSASAISARPRSCSGARLQTFYADGPAPWLHRQRPRPRERAAQRSKVPQLLPCYRETAHFASFAVTGRRDSTNTFERAAGDGWLSSRRTAVRWLTGVAAFSIASSSGIPSTYCSRGGPQLIHSFRFGRTRKGITVASNADMAGNH